MQSHSRWTTAVVVIAALCLMATPPVAAEEAAGELNLNVYFARGFNDSAWQRAAFDKVAKGWTHAEPPALGKKTVVIVTVVRDGSVLEAKIGTASGSEAWDKAALEALKKAAPFPGLPDSWATSSLEVHFHFTFAAKK